MKKIEIHHFQNLTIKNAKTITTPLIQAKPEEADTLSVVFIRDPYAYFDTLLFDYLQHKRSILFTQDIINNMKKLDHTSFLQWFDTLNFIPFYNPQTFQLNISKISLIAIENLESFDYVIPYEEIDLFLENVAPHLKIIKVKENKLIFSLSSQKEKEILTKFIGKDLELYARASELWELVKKNNFKPLGSLIERKKSLDNTPSLMKPNKMKNYNGVAGKITSYSIVGWVHHKEKEEIIKISIYKNNTFLCRVKANKMREDLKKQKLHLTGICGFEVIFDELTFQKGDNIEIKILPDNIILPLGKGVKDFLKKS